MNILKDETEGDLRGFFTSQVINGWTLQGFLATGAGSLFYSMELHFLRVTSDLNSVQGPLLHHHIHKYIPSQGYKNVRD